jgi:hypothetical protein
MPIHRSQPNRILVGDFLNYEKRHETHTQLNLSTAIPELILVTTDSVHNLNNLDLIRYEANSFYIMDREYIDYKRLFTNHERGAYFVTRAKNNMSHCRVYSHDKEDGSGVMYNQSVKMYNHYAAQDYPVKIRRIKYKDAYSGKTLIFLTNNFQLKATDIAQLYKNRWKIELFFKWIKKHLKIKSFWGLSENAVKSKIRIAISVYVLVAIAKKRFMIKQSLNEILQVLSISFFDKVPVNQLFTEHQQQYFKDQNDNQLKIFDL